jgi:hypothetical protein
VAMQENLWRVPTQNVPSPGSNRVSRPGSGGQLWRSAPAKRTRTGRLFLRGPGGGHSTNWPDIGAEPCGSAEQRRLGEEMIRAWRGAWCTLPTVLAHHVRPRGCLGSELAAFDTRALPPSIHTDAVVAAAPLAPRFSVRPGEALLIDNYRMLHARDPFVGARLMYRVHCWTDERMWSALPTCCNCGCGTPLFHPERMRGAAYVPPPSLLRAAAAADGTPDRRTLRPRGMAGEGTWGVHAQPPVHSCTHNRWCVAPPPEVDCLDNAELERWYSALAAKHGQSDQDEAWE